MFGLLERKPTITDMDNVQALKLSKVNIQFEQVNFHYHPDRAILKQVSITIPAGSKVAIVGESSGKSTLVKLLFRFYDVTSGAITIDGQAINEVTQHSLRSAIGIVPQDTVLFNDTLFENVRYGKPTATDAEVFHARNGTFK